MKPRQFTGETYFGTRDRTVLTRASVESPKINEEINRIIWKIAEKMRGVSSAGRFLCIAMHSGCLCSGGAVILQEHSIWQQQGDIWACFCTELSELNPALSVMNRLTATVSFLLRNVNESTASSHSPAHQHHYLLPAEQLLSQTESHTHQT